MTHVGSVQMPKRDRAWLLGACFSLLFLGALYSQSIQGLTDPFFVLNRSSYQAGLFRQDSPGSGWASTASGSTVCREQMESC